MLWNARSPGGQVRGVSFSPWKKYASPACSSHCSPSLTATPQWPWVWPRSGTSRTSSPRTATESNPSHSSPRTRCRTQSGPCAHWASAVAGPVAQRRVHRSVELVLEHVHAGRREVPEPAGVVEVEVGEHDVGDVLRLVTECGHAGRGAVSADRAPDPRPPGTADRAASGWPGRRCRARCRPGADPSGRSTSRQWATSVAGSDLDAPAAEGMHRRAVEVVDRHAAILAGPLSASGRPRPSCGRRRRSRGCPTTAVEPTTVSCACRTDVDSHRQHRPVSCTSFHAPSSRESSRQSRVRDPPAASVDVTQDEQCRRGWPAYRQCRRGLQVRGVLAARCCRQL